MTKEEILKTYLEDEMMVEKGYLEEGEGENSKWMDHRNNKMVEVIKFAIDGVINGDSQAVMTRKINQFLEKS